ncbi:MULTISPECIES: NAD-dependent epimerase/dehydratase family protein [Deinococcus]|uniref:NAD-dependent epimerase/dehydratase family protein n=1 Tax=Deinococcus rufus TaxID=2136097 RepID=A0ABV7Z3I9_9DEIO|nr:NAD-dependent epimerase/dehydratase family protein [Deinococcus sp. AB2017081]WQE95832.1 NAD-dependent epimerase/dehydratase family protein [Deinococcus sp. AB2017081]
MTGGNGYLGAWVIDGLLRGGTDVRAVIRTLDSAALLRDALRRRDTDDTGLELVVADVAGGTGLAQAFAGTQEVYHLASPMQHGGTSEQIVDPARDSALYVLRAARDAGSRRVVFTSSFAAVGYSPKPVREYTEDDWTDPATPGLPLYPLSKTMAERAAWDFMAREGGDMELVVLNPTFIAGPPLTAELRSSLHSLTAA